MKQNYQIILMILGIVIVSYTFISLQFLPGIIAIGIIVAALIILPPVEQQEKSR
jgi:hypothetical protein